MPAKKHGKRFEELAKKIERGREYSPDEGIKLVKETSQAKFDTTVELHPGRSRPSGPRSSARSSTARSSARWRTPSAPLERFSRYYNYHRLHGEIGWLTPGERYDGTPFTDRGFENVTALAHLRGWLEDLGAAA